MDRLTLEHKEIPVYMRNLYMITPEPARLKRDIHWDILTTDVDCPYCREDNAVDLFDNGEFFMYVDPEGYLRFLNMFTVNKIDIMFCPMCGRQLK